MKKQAITSITLLAYFHRYGWWVLLVLVTFFTKNLYVLSIGLIIFAIWSFLGYIFQWKHIFCSYQNAYRKQMTPDNIQWVSIKKSDALGVPLIFFVMGIASLLVLAFS